MPKTATMRRQHARKIERSDEKASPVEFGALDERQREQPRRGRARGASRSRRLQQREADDTADVAPRQAYCFRLGQRGTDRQRL